MNMNIKEHNLRAVGLVLIFLAYFAWRINMTGFNPVILLFTTAATIGLIILVKKYCGKPKGDKKRKQDRVIFIMILVLFLAAVLIRILFLS